MWIPVTVDLSAYAGFTVTLEWTFDPGDSLGRDLRGWFIDDIVVTGAPW